MQKKHQVQKIKS